MLAFAIVLSASGREPANVSCPAAPTFLSSMRDGYRPLLLFAPSLKDPEFVHHTDELRAHDSEVKEREIIVVPIISNDTAAPLPTDLPSTVLSQIEDAAAQSRFKVSADSIWVILIGKDGSQKFSSKTPVSFDNLQRTRVPAPPCPGQAGPSLFDNFPCPNWRGRNRGANLFFCSTLPLTVLIFENLRTIVL